MTFFGNVAMSHKWIKKVLVQDSELFHFTCWGGWICRHVLLYADDDFVYIRCWHVLGSVLPFIMALRQVRPNLMFLYQRLWCHHSVIVGERRTVGADVRYVSSDLYNSRITSRQVIIQWLLWPIRIWSEKKTLNYSLKRSVENNINISIFTHLNSPSVGWSLSECENKACRLLCCRWRQ